MTSRFHSHGTTTVPHVLLRTFLVLRRHYAGSFVSRWNALLALRGGAGGGALGRKGNLLPECVANTVKRNCDPFGVEQSHRIDLHPSGRSVSLREGADSEARLWSQWQDQPC